MSAANNISVRSIKVADTENVTFRGAIFGWHRHMSAIFKIVFLRAYSHQEFKNCAKSTFLKLFRGLKKR